MLSKLLPPTLAVLLAASFLTTNIFAASAKAPGLGDRGKLQAISVATGEKNQNEFYLSGRDSSHQLLVSGEYSSGQVHDLTGKVSYSATPEGIVEIDATGWVTPVAEGRATIHVQGPDGMDTLAAVTVTNIKKDIRVNFPNEVVPIFTKYGCNSGGCHGKASGQNGFKLSLLGFEPTEDYEHLVHEARGRRLFPAAPDRSLLLTKMSGGLPHGGGLRIAVDSPPYRVLRRWIEQGMPYGSPDDPIVKRIEVLPKERTMNDDAEQQLAVIAHYSDGSTKDVTRMTQFTSNDTEMAEISETGLVNTGNLTGTVAIMTRFQGQVDVSRVTIPLGASVDELPPAKNFIDELVYKQLKKLGLPASKLSDDATFLRRVTVDIAGRLPSKEEAEHFLSSNDPDKRQHWIDELLSSTDYADFFANKWNAILRNKRNNNTGKISTYAFHDWIRNSLHENKPYDQFTREILTASGEVGKNPPVAWYNEVRDQSAQLEDTAQLFLGMRIQCAKCHHHPFEKWSQEDYYGFSAFFSQVARKRARTPNNRGPENIYHRRGIASAQNPKTGNRVKPTGLGSAPMEIPADEDPRQKLVDWMSAPENPFFARALVNRYWKHFFSRGLVDPEDDMRVTNPASNPELLDALSRRFIESKFDLKDLVRTICSSQVYQLSAEPNEYNQGDKQNYSRYFPKRLNAEVLLDAIDQLTLSPTKFSGVPLGTRAIQLPDNGFNSYFLTVFGRPEMSSACECERSSDANLAQSLHLLNSGEIQGKVTGTRADRLAGKDKRSHEEKIRELYLVSFSREPEAEEIEIALEHIRKNEKQVKQAYEDIIWALINTKEFLFNH